MRYFTRTEVLEILAIDEAFLLALETEEIIEREREGVETEEIIEREREGLETEEIIEREREGVEKVVTYSEVMLERVRVADNLVHELDVNLAGVAVIVQMRETLADLRRQLEAAVVELQSRSR